MPGAQQKDLDPNTYIGLSFPIRRDDNNDFRLTKKIFRSYLFFILIPKKLLYFLYTDFIKFKKN